MFSWFLFYFFVKVGFFLFREKEELYIWFIVFKFFCYLIFLFFVFILFEGILVCDCGFNNNLLFLEKVYIKKGLV